MLEYWIWLATRQGLNKRKQYELLQRFGDPEAVYRSFAQAEDLQQAQQILHRCREQGIQLLTLEDPRYPRRLKGIYEPPLLLYYRGSLPDWEAKPVIGAVGTRRCSRYGLRCAHRMAQQLILCGATAGVIRASVEQAENYAGLEIVDVADYHEAVALADSRSSEGDVVILSPASTSFDRFANFMERGRVFKAIVNELK